MSILSATKANPIATASSLIGRMCSMHDEQRSVPRVEVLYQHHPAWNFLRVREWPQDSATPMGMIFYDVDASYLVPLD